MIRGRAYSPLYCDPLASNSEGQESWFLEVGCPTSARLRELTQFA